jgi:hypothetical protein
MLGISLLKKIFFAIATHAKLVNIAQAQPSPVRRAKVSPPGRDLEGL